MGCIYEDNDGMCTLAFDLDEEGKVYENKPRGCDSRGRCVSSEDPDPSVSCDEYESDWRCWECDADLNIEECKCGEDEDL